MKTISKSLIPLSSSPYSVRHFLMACAVAFGCSASSASAQTTWAGGTSSSWNTAANWSPSGVPTITTPVYFDAPNATGTTITLDGLSNQIVGANSSLNFNLNAFSGSTGYTIAQGSGTSSLAYSAYDILTTFTGKNITETISAPLIAGLYSTNSKENITLANYTPETSNSVLTNLYGGDNSGNLLSITGAITFDTDTTTANAYTLTMQGLGNGAISGPINMAVGSNTAKLNLILDSTGTWTLSNSASANNTFGDGGTTTVGGGGTLVLDYSNSTNNSTEYNIIGTTGTTLGGTDSGGGTLEIISNATNTTSNINPGRITVAAGANRIVIVGTGATQAYVSTNNQSIVRTVGGTLDTTVSTVAGTDEGGLFASGTTNTDNILGGWATVNGGADWASISNSNPNGTGYLESFTEYTTASSLTGYTNNTWATGNNTDVTLNALTIAASAVTNTLRFNTTTALNLTLSGTNAATGDTITSGGILVTPTVGANNVNISGGVLQPGSSNELILNQYDTAGTLTIGSEILLTGTSTAQALTISGGGKVILNGANSFLGTTTTYINQGVVQLGNSSALGAASSTNKNSLIIGGQATLDLHGNSISIFALNDDAGDTNSGTVLANAGLTDNITNTAAGTISILNIGVTGVTSANSAFTGGLTEASGAILSLQTTGTTTLQIGGNIPLGGGQSGSGNAANQTLSNYNLITGAIVIGTGSTIKESGDTMLLTSGAMDINGTFNGTIQFQNAGANYLTGSGTIIFSGDGVLAIGTAGTVADAFAGSIGGPSSNEGVALSGTGTLTLPQITTTGGSSLYLTGTSTLITPGVTTGFSNNFPGGDLSGNSTLKLIATSGPELNTGISFDGGTLLIAPTTVSASTAIAVSNANQSGVAASWFVDGGGTLELSANGNQSVTLTLGNGASNTTANTIALSGVFNRRTTGATFVIEAADGLANLGTTDRLNLNVSAAALPTLNTGSEVNGIITPWMVGQDSDANKSAGFLVYSGTTANSSTDTGFIAATPGNINNLSASTATTVARVTNTQTITSATSVYGLEIDNNAATDTGGTLTGVDMAGVGSAGSVVISGATLTITSGSATDALILNGGSITGVGPTSKLAMVGGEIYTSLAGGTISVGGGFNSTSNLSIFGPGVLTIASGTAFTVNSGNSIYIDSGVLDLAGGVSALPTTAGLALRGGVLESNGTFTEALGNGNGQVNWALASSTIPSAGGGFAAQGGALTVAIGGTVAPTALTWGASTGDVLSKNQGINGTAFLGEYGDLDFGATNATNIVNFENAINLGISGVSPIYWRTVQVTANSSDGSNPFAAADPAVLSGVISSGYAFHGLAVAGNGVLALTAANTYTGATSIASGASLLIDADDNLGTAPTAPYALNTTPGLNGGAITPGAVVIDGGGTLGIYGAVGSGGVGTYAGSATTVAISSDRTILLASGATGSTPSNINVLGGTTASFGGLVGDYVNEVGTLNKNGAGTLALTNSTGNSYSGGTIISAGTLLVNNTTSGSGTGTGSVFVNSGGTLGGSGIIAPTVTTAGSVAFAAGSTLAPGTAGNTDKLTLRASGSTSGLVSLTGAVTLAFNLNSGLASNTLSLTNSYANEVSGLGSSDIFKFTDLTSNSTLSLGEYTLITTDDSSANPLGVTTAGLAGATIEGLGASAYSGDIFHLQVNQLGNGDYALQLDISQAAPEPGTWALMLGGFAVLIIIQRRRNKIG